MDKRRLNDLIESIKNTPWKKKAYTKTDVLIIDEASMLHPDLFDILNMLMKDLRGPENRHLPFGGLQMIICGDFFQLPPVVSRLDSTFDDGKSNSVLRQYISKEEGNEPYLFDSKAWKELVNADMKMIELSNVFRQRDPLFLKILDEMRRGVCSKGTWDILEECRGKKWPIDGILVILSNLII